MQACRGALVMVVLAAACSGGSDAAEPGGDEPVPVVPVAGTTDQGVRMRIDVVGDREVRLDVAVDCGFAPGADELVPRSLPEDVLTVPVADDGSFRIEESLEESDAQDLVVHLDLDVEGRFTADGTASGTFGLTENFSSTEDEEVPEPCSVEVPWSADEPVRFDGPDLPAGLPTWMFAVAAPDDDGLLVVPDGGEPVRVGPEGEARRLDGSPPPTSPDTTPDGHMTEVVSAGDFDVAVAGDGVWASGGPTTDHYPLAGGDPTARIDVSLQALEVGHGALWTVSFGDSGQSRSLDKRDPATGAALASIPVLAGTMAVDETGVWYAYGTWEAQFVDRFDPATLERVEQVRIDETDLAPDALVPQADQVWLLYDSIGSPGLVRLDRATGEREQVDLPTRPAAIAPGDDGTVWALHPLEDAVRRVDASGEVVELVDLPDGDWSVLAAGPATVWAAGLDDPYGSLQAHRLTPP